MASSYDSIRAQVDNVRAAGHREERVEVNQRALIDKILARYASAGAVYRELLQNSNDADATIAEVYFTTSSTSTSTASTAASSSIASSTLESSVIGTVKVGRNSSNIVSSVKYRNNGMPFRPQDWDRLKKIAEGNPDESKIGAFGVGAYTMFSICEEPIVLSGNQALAFIWKGDALWTKTVDNDNGVENKGWTCFILPSRDPYQLPNLEEFGEFLCASLTFTKSLKEIRVFVNEQRRMTITKTQIQEPSVVQIQKSSSWWKSDGAITASPNGLFSLQDENALLESFYHIQVSLDGETAGITARYLSAIAKTKIPAEMTKRMERVTKKKPPSKVEVQIFLNGQHQTAFESSLSSSSKSSSHSNNKRNNKAFQIIQSFSPRIGEGRIFIGFRTSQTTGLAAHLAAPFVPTVEREAMDLQDQTLRLFNLELLEFSGILMRLTLEHGMNSVGIEYTKGAAERAELEERLLKEEGEKKKKPTPPTSTSDDDEDTVTTTDQTVSTTDAEEQETNKKSRVWGFAKYMAKGVTKTIVKVVNKVEALVDDSGGELLNPRDPRPLCAEEHQAILLMQSFCPRQSTPDRTVGMALAQGFSRCLPEKAPPVLTRAGVVPGDNARLPNKGMEAFCKDRVVRSIVYQNAEEYHKVIAQCQPLDLSDLADALSRNVLEEEHLIRLLKWWVRFTKAHGHISSSMSLDIKERVQFFMKYKVDSETYPVFKLRDFLFYLDKDMVRTGSGFSIDALPMPDSVLPRVVQDSVTTRNLTDPSLGSWFEPLPTEIWIEYISHHECMTAGQPEDEKLRLQVLSTLSQEYTRRSPPEQSAFGSFCESVFRERRCIPFDSIIPTSYAADCPSNLYLYSAELDAFDGIGNFHKVSQSLKHMGITDEFLVALGVRKSVAIDFLFANLETLKWSSDPKPLIEYLRTASLTPKDHAKLKSTQYLPCENDVSRMFAPHELYLPDRELRIFPFVQLLQWPSGDEITERSQNGRFLVGLGVKVLPPLTDLLRYASDGVDDDTLRIKCLDFASQRIAPGGAYQAEYSRIGRPVRMGLKFLPCEVFSPLDGQSKKGLYSVLTCCSEERCSVMGFPVIDPSLGDRAKVFGNVFQCPKEPDPGALVEQLVALVSSAKQLLRQSPPSDRPVVAQTVLAAFSRVFEYMSVRTTEIHISLMRKLENERFIPCMVEDQVVWFEPKGVFFKGSDEMDASVTQSLFHVVDFSPFLASAGVKQEASTRDIFRRMIESPQAVLSAVKSEEKYRMFLRRVAAHRPFERVTAEIQNSPFLLAYSVPGDGSSDKSQYELALAKDIYIVDNSFFARMFPVKRAPPESDLEEFYALIGARYISKEVEKKFDVIGARKSSSNLTMALLQRIQERSPLLVSASVTSRPLVANAASVLDEKHLQVYEADEIKAVYSLGKSIRSQRTTCCSRPGSRHEKSLFVTADFDWFDVGYAIGELILERCQLEDAFFISSLLEAPLEQLRARGFPVDRIIKPEPIPEPAPVVKQAQHEPPTHSMQPPLDAKVENAEISAVKSDIESADRDERSSSRNKKDTSHVAPGEEMPSPAVSQDDYVRALQQMFPTAEESYIRSRLGGNPSMQDVQSLAEEMSMGGFPEKASTGTTTNQDGIHEANETRSKAGKVFGSKKLGNAFKGLRSGNFSKGSVDGGQNHAGAGNITGPVNRRQRDSPVSAAADAQGHHNMEKLLQSTVKASNDVDPTGVRSPEVNLSVPEGLDKGSTCEVIPGHDLKPFLGINDKGVTHNSIKVFSARKHSSSHDFLANHLDALESFAVVIERLCRVFELPLSSVAIFHDPTGGVIAFNLNRALHFNLRFFFSLHYTKNQQSSRACYSYWYVTFCHELAHHMASGHTKEHGFYTESYVSLYLPKCIALMSQLEH